MHRVTNSDYHFLRSVICLFLNCSKQREYYYTEKRYSKFSNLGTYVLKLHLHTEIEIYNTKYIHYASLEAIQYLAKIVCIDYILVWILWNITLSLAFLQTLVNISNNYFATTSTMFSIRINISVILAFRCYYFECRTNICMYWYSIANISNVVKSSSL